MQFFQGYVEIKECPLDLSDSMFDGMEAGPEAGAKLPDFYTIILISRRSRYRAGKTKTDKTIKRLGPKLYVL